MADGDINPWMGEQDVIKREALLKLAEELAEAAKEAIRCAMHGTFELHTDGDGLTNYHKLVRELQDVTATKLFVDKEVDSMLPYVEEGRTTRKFEGFRQWAKLMREELAKRK